MISFRFVSHILAVLLVSAVSFRSFLPFWFLSGGFGSLFKPVLVHAGLAVPFMKAGVRNVGSKR